MYVCIHIYTCIKSPGGAFRLSKEKRRKRTGDKIREGKRRKKEEERGQEERREEVTESLMFTMGTINFEKLLYVYSYF